MDVEVNDLIRVVVRMAGPHGEAINVRHYEVTSEVGAGSSLEEFLFEWIDVVGVPYQQVAGSTLRFISVSGIKIAPTTGAVLSGVVEKSMLPSTGVVDFPLLPAQVCGLITFRTVKAGPKWRGRAYIAGPTEDDNNDVDQNPTTDYVTRLDALAGAMVLPITFGGGGDTSTMTPCIWSKVAVGDHTETIIAKVARTQWCTMRSRLLQP